MPESNNHAVIEKDATAESTEQDVPFDILDAASTYGSNLDILSLVALISEASELGATKKEIELIRKTFGVEAHKAIDRIEAEQS